MATFNNSSLAQRQAVTDAYQAGIEATSNAEAYFTLQSQDMTLDPIDRANFADGAAQANKDRNLLQAQLDAYMNDSPLGDVTPPDPPTVAQVQALATDVQTMTLANNAATDILSSLTQLLHIIGSA